MYSSIEAFVNDSCLWWWKSAYVAVPSFDMCDLAGQVELPYWTQLEGSTQEISIMGKHKGNKWSVWNLERMVHVEWEEDTRECDCIWVDGTNPTYFDDHSGGDKRVQGVSSGTSVTLLVIGWIIQGSKAPTLKEKK